MKNQELEEKAYKMVSSGFVVQSSTGKYLIGRAGRHDEKFGYTVFKGQVEGNETLIDAAIRELKEETGIDVNADHRLNKNISTNPIYNYNLRHKEVYIFMLNDVEGALDDFQFVCSSNWQENCPEILDYKWVSLEDMDKFIFPSQRGLVDKLKGMRK